jgi:hypothetical protein
MNLALFWVNLLLILFRFWMHILEQTVWMEDRQSYLGCVLGFLSFQ